MHIVSHLLTSSSTLTERSNFSKNGLAMANFKNKLFEDYMYQIQQKFSVNTPAMLTCLLKQGNGHRIFHFIDTLRIIGSSGISCNRPTDAKVKEWKAHLDIPMYIVIIFRQVVIVYIFCCLEKLTKEFVSSYCLKQFSSISKRKNLVTLGNLIDNGFPCQVPIIPEVERSSDGDEDDGSSPALHCKFQGVKITTIRLG